MTSVVIPVQDPGESLPLLLGALRRQSVNLDIVLVDSSRQEDVLPVADEFKARFIKISAAEYDHGKTRTMGAKNTDSEIIIYMSQDVIPKDTGAIERLLQPVRDNPSVGAAYGRQIPLRQTAWNEVILREFNYPAESAVRSLGDGSPRGIKATFISNAFAAYRRTAMDDIGWFKNGIIMGEDVHAGARLMLGGYSIAYAADAIVYHQHDYSPFEEMKRYFDIGVFHHEESWILDKFGKPEKEGIHYMKYGVNILVKRGQRRHIPQFLFRSMLKYVGYKFGLYHNLLPAKLVLTMSRNPQWWYRIGKDEI